MRSMALVRWTCSLLARSTRRLAWVRTACVRLPSFFASRLFAYARRRACSPAPSFDYRALSDIGRADGVWVMEFACLPDT